MIRFSCCFVCNFVFIYLRKTIGTWKNTMQTYINHYGHLKVHWNKRVVSNWVFKKDLSEKHKHSPINHNHRMRTNNVACVPLVRSAEHCDAGRASCHDIRVVILPLLLWCSEGLYETNILIELTPLVLFLRGITKLCTFVVFVLSTICYCPPLWTLAAYILSNCGGLFLIDYIFR